MRACQAVPNAIALLPRSNRANLASNDPVHSEPVRFHSVTAIRLLPCLPFQFAAAGFDRSVSKRNPVHLPSLSIHKKSPSPGQRRGGFPALFPYLPETSQPVSAGIGTVQHRGVSWLPGFIGPVPPPLLIREIVQRSYQVFRMFSKVEEIISLKRTFGQGEYLCMRAIPHALR